MRDVSVCLFATVVLHAYARRNAVYHHLFLALAVVHEWGHLDWLVSHFAFALVTSDLLAAGAPAMLAWPLAVALAWALDAPAALLHALAAAGMHACLAAL